MFKLIHRVVNNKIKENVDNGYNQDEMHTNMLIAIEKFLQKYKVADAKNLDLIKPDETEIIMYLIYIIQKQKDDHMEALNNIQKLIDFKIDMYNGNLNKTELDGLINIYKAQIK